MLSLAVVPIALLLSAQLAAPEANPVQQPVAVEMADASTLSPQQGTAAGSTGTAGGDDPAQAEPPPAPMHTGVSAIVRAIGTDFATFPRRRSTWAILGAGAVLALAAHPIDHDLNAHLAGSGAVGHFFAPGKVIGSTWAQLGVSTGLYVVGRYVVPSAQGRPQTNRLSHLGYDLLQAQVVTQALVQGIKISVRRDRPTGECCSFPSGHAASAFALASVLERHLGYRAAVPTMVIATYVAASRLHDNRHFLSDVAFGSAIGLATGWTVVGRHGRSQYAVVPIPVNRGLGLALTRTSHRAEISTHGSINQ